MNNRAAKKRSFLAREVVQTSAMDCGPASLKCLLEGFGITASYGRLREACQTSVDGTSIDAMEEIACQLGLEAEQVMVPLDHLLLPESGSLPAIVVTRNASGSTHFVVLWGRTGPFVQVMDPATGRRWPAGRDLLRDIYLHEMSVHAEAWREWAGSENFLAPLRRRLSDLGLRKKNIEHLVSRALRHGGWRPIAALDAATRMADAITRSGAIRRGRQAAIIVARYFDHSVEEVAGGAQQVPDNYWLARPAAPDENGEPQVTVRGAILVTVRGKKDDSRAGNGQASAARSLSPELTAALEEKRERPLKELFGFLRADGLFAPALIAAALALAACGVIIEALLFQSLFELSRRLNIAEQRIGAMAMLMVFVVALLLIEAPLAASFLRMGRKLETRLRLAFLRKIPRLGDRYFQSRLISDMAERGHMVQTLRTLPALGGQFVRAVSELMLTTAGIIWLNPAGATAVLAAAAAAVSLPLLIQSRLTERDLRIRNHNAALGRFYLDSLLGIVAVRTHGAEQSVRREHESLLVEWMHASFGLLRAVVMVEAVQSLLGFGLTAWLLLNYFATTDQYGGVLLLVYWSLNLPVLGEEVAQIAHQYPLHRNVTLRLLEPLGAPEETDSGTAARAENYLAQDVERELEVAAATSLSAEAPGFILVKPSVTRDERIALNGRESASNCRGVRLTIEGVSVRAAGHVILEDVNLEIEPGSHVAIVGPSGAGKSSLAGLLLGWHKATGGQVLVDGEALDSERLERLREETAWVDPAVQLWNRSLLENLSYGAPPEASTPISSVIESAELRRVLEKLPEGFQTPLGESGSLLSGGEGQRVRLGRAMLRGKARLVVLDEAFRGLSRERRRDLLSGARKLWQGSTLLCITHDVGETQAFERVLVIDGGRIVEDGDPADLMEQTGSRYRDLVEAEETLRAEMWASDRWHNIRLEGGQIVEGVQRSKE